MREIKFRAWDKEEKFMWHQENDNFSFFEGKTLKGEARHGNLHGLVDYGCELMQYTGLKDKNGGEIYEGDLLREWIVEEHPSDLVYKVGCESGHFTLTDIKNGYDRMGIWNVHSNMEIIGNIYENPELLK